MTWLPLLVLGLVTFGAIPVYRYGHRVLSDCQTVDGGQVCKVSFHTVIVYWLAALVLAYVLIAGGYLRVARARGVDARVLPYAGAGVALVGLGFAFAAVWLRLVPLDYAQQPSAPLELLFRLLDPPGAIGLALLVLAWLERHVELLLFTLAYLAVVLVPINFGWGDHWGSQWQSAPMLVISGGLLLLGSAGFALAQRLRRPR